MSQTAFCFRSSVSFAFEVTVGLEVCYWWCLLNGNIKIPVRQQFVLYDNRVCMPLN